MRHSCAPLVIGVGAGGGGGAVAGDVGHDLGSGLMPSQLGAVGVTR
jgi:hypothetical protein